MKRDFFSGAQLIIEFKDVRGVVLQDTHIEVIFGEQKIHLNGQEATIFASNYQKYLINKHKSEWKSVALCVAVTLLVHILVCSHVVQ